METLIQCIMQSSVHLFSVKTTIFFRNFTQFFKLYLRENLNNQNYTV